MALGGVSNNTNLEKKIWKANLSLVAIILQHVRDLMQECFRVLLLLRVWCSPLLVLVQTTGEISEQTVDTDLVEPILIFNIGVLIEIEVQVLVLISESVWMHLQYVMINKVVRPLA